MDASLAAYLARLPAATADRLREDPLAGIASPGASFSAQLRAAGLVRRAGSLLATHAAETTLVIASWVFIGTGALNGRSDSGWGAAWALCLASIVPLRMTARWLEGVIVVGLGGLLKERLLAGATMLDPEIVRHKGAGDWLGDLLEAETIERLSASGGLQAVLAAIELLAVPVVLAFGAAARAEIVVLLAWMALTLGLIAANTRRRSAWTMRRLELTQELVDGMTAHRTRVVQQRASEWHREEDRQLDAFADVSTGFDRSTAWIDAVVPRGYTLAALVALAPSFVSGAGGATVAKQAITLAAILFAADAFATLTGLTRAAAAWIAWRTVRPLFDAAATSPTASATASPVAVTGKAAIAGSGHGSPEAVETAGDLPSVGHTVLRAEDLRFTHNRRTEPVVHGCTLTVARGDFLLLEGASGSGKSTLVSLLAGARTPSAGVVLAGGLDLPTLGRAAWRRRIAIAPQYHDNHVLSATFGFNLLLGRPYPHSAHDLREAHELCLELGLGPLLERMPAGLDQMVGEAGWQLSHGERSRVFLARALLQRADLIILDESLATLDPDTLRECQACLFRRAETLMVVAHP